MRGTGGLRQPQGRAAIALETQPPGVYPATVGEVAYALDLDTRGHLLRAHGLRVCDRGHGLYDADERWCPTCRAVYYVVLYAVIEEPDIW